MKSKIFSLLPVITLSLSLAAYAAQPKMFSDEVTDVDPIGGRITFKTHGEYFVDKSDLLRGVGRRDLVDVELAEAKGDAPIVKLIKTGVAPEEQKGLAVGAAVRDVLKATNATAQFVTSPVPAAQDATSATVGSVTDATGAAVEDARGPQTSHQF